MAENWDKLARSIGYEDEKEMLIDLYNEMSIADIADRLGAGTATIGRRLSLHGIEKKARGGANNQANQKKKLFYMDQRLVFFLNLPDLSKHSRISRSTCYHYRKSITGGKLDAVLSDIAVQHVEPVFDVVQRTLGVTAGQ